MQANYDPCRDIMRACREAPPTGIRFTVLCREFPDNPARDDCYDDKILEEQRFLRGDKLCAIAGDAAFESVQWIRLSHLQAAEQFPEKADGPAN